MKSYKIFEKNAAGICVSSFSFEIIRIQRTAYASSLSNVGQKRVMILKEVKRRDISQIFKSG